MFMSSNCNFDESPWSLDWWPFSLSCAVFIIRMFTWSISSPSLATCMHPRVQKRIFQQINRRHESRTQTFVVPTNLDRGPTFSAPFVESSRALLAGNAAPPRPPHRRRHFYFSENGTTCSPHPFIGPSCCRITCISVGVVLFAAHLFFLSTLISWSLRSTKPFTMPRTYVSSKSRQLIFFGHQLSDAETLSWPFFSLPHTHSQSSP